MTDLQWRNALKRIQKQLKKKSAKEVKRIRAEYRERYGMIYVGEYTVEAHWRKTTKRPRGRIVDHQPSPAIH